MSVLVLAVQVGVRSTYSNPPLNWRDRDRVEELARDETCQNITQVVTGTGSRHQETARIFIDSRAIREDKSFISPLLGNPDYSVSGGIILSDGRFVLETNYHRLTDRPEFDLWSYLTSLGPGTLIITEVEFLVRLGVDEPRPYTFYRVDAKQQTVSNI